MSRRSRVENDTRFRQSQFAVCVIGELMNILSARASVFTSQWMAFTLPQTALDMAVLVHSGMYPTARAERFIFSCSRDGRKYRAGYIRKMVGKLREVICSGNAESVLKPGR